MDGQLVLAGIKADLESLVDTFKEAGAKRAIVLDMSVASHCELLTAAVENLKPYLEEYLKDEFSPVISNVTAEAYSTKDEAIDLLSSQLTSPVKYKQSILANTKVDAFIEFGNGIVLKGLNRKICKQVPTLNVSDFASLEKTIEALND